MRHLWTIVPLALSGFFAWLFYERYWKWRDCIDEALSSCITPDGDNLTGGGMFWSVFSVLFGLLALYAMWANRSRRGY
jgi:hypothetical protein